MRARTLILFFGLFVGMLWAACERNRRAIGGEPRTSTELLHTSVLETANIPGPAHIAALAPSVAQPQVPPADLFMRNCMACHQLQGQGIAGVFPPLAASPYVASENQERMASIMVYGLMGPIKVNGVQYSSVMPGLGAALSDKDLSAIASYVRSSFGNQASPIPPEIFAKVRQKWKTRGPFNIVELGEEG